MEVNLKYSLKNKFQKAIAKNARMDQRKSFLNQILLIYQCNSLPVERISSDTAYVPLLILQLWIWLSKNAISSFVNKFDEVKQTKNLHTISNAIME